MLKKTMKRRRDEEAKLPRRSKRTRKSIIPQNRQVNLVNGETKQSVKEASDMTYHLTSTEYRNAIDFELDKLMQSKYDELGVTKKRVANTMSKIKEELFGINKYSVHKTYAKQYQADLDDMERNLKEIEDLEHKEGNLTNRKLALINCAQGLSLFRQNFYMDTKLPYDVLDELEKVQNGTIRVDGDYKQAVENWFYQQSKEKGKTKMSKNLINYCKTEK